MHDHVYADGQINHMKYLITIFILFLLISDVNANWINNPFTRKPDYYEESGVTPIPQPYQQEPTVLTLRDLLVAVGIMSPRPLGYVITFQDDPVVKAVFQDDPTVNVVFQDVPEISAYAP